MKKNVATHRLMYFEVKKKSRNGVEYTNYKKAIVPLVWEKKDGTNEQQFAIKSE